MSKIKKFSGAKIAEKNIKATMARFTKYCQFKIKKNDNLGVRNAFRHIKTYFRSGLSRRPYLNLWVYSVVANEPAERRRETGEAEAL